MCNYSHRTATSATGVTRVLSLVCVKRFILISMPKRYLNFIDLIVFKRVCFNYFCRVLIHVSCTFTAIIAFTAFTYAFLFMMLHMFFSMAEKRFYSREYVNQFRCNTWNNNIISLYRRKKLLDTLVGPLTLLHPMLTPM